MIIYYKDLILSCWDAVHTTLQIETFADKDGNPTEYCLLCRSTSSSPKKLWSPGCACGPQ